MKENEKILEKIPPHGSLGLLALGHRGLILWREARKKHEEAQNSQK